MTAEGLTVYDIEPGRVVGERYEIVGTSRQGGLSTAFEVRDVGDGARFEMQIFPSALFDGDEQARQFVAAWEPWRRLESDAVLGVRQILRVGETALVLITDYPDGEPLRSVLGRRARLGPDEVVRVGVQILEGLVEIHAHGLVHGDIKPYTIHLDEPSGDGGETGELHATLVDGGITPALWSAKHLGEKTALIGTPYYAPVEQFGGESPDVQSDVYNVAAVLFEAASGALPWPGTSYLEVFQAKLDRRPPSMRARAPEVDVDPALEEAIVRGCLADRSERYPSAVEFLRALEPHAAPA